MSDPTPHIAIWRGVRGTCPACGKAPLFETYLKPVEQCVYCAEQFSDISADDGPSWLTILMLGPVLALLAFVASMSGWSLFVTIPTLAVSIIAAVLLVLPRVKGGFIAALFLARNSDGHAKQ